MVSLVKTVLGCIYLSGYVQASKAFRTVSRHLRRESSSKGYYYLLLSPSGHYRQQDIVRSVHLLLTPPSFDNVNGEKMGEEPTISISDAFDGGNIKLVKIKKRDEHGQSIVDVVLNIKPDVYTELEQIAHKQYFSFRVTVSGLPPLAIASSSSSSTPPVVRIKYVIDNAAKVSYPEAWAGTTVCFSNNFEDVDSWRRNQDTFYTEGKLWWEHTHNSNGSVFFSFFPPYSYHRHLNLIAKCTESPKAVVSTLGQVSEPSCA